MTARLRSCNSSGLIASRKSFSPTRSAIAAASPINARTILRPPFGELQSSPRLSAGTERRGAEHFYPLVRSTSGGIAHGNLGSVRV